jgi:hypothetical protein
MWMLSRHSRLARIVPRRISLVSSITIVVRRDTLNRNVVVYRRTRNLS